MLDKKKSIMAKVSGQRALYTNAKQAKHTFVSLGGKLEKTKDQSCKKTFLSFQSISAGGFLYKSGIRKGDRLISVNFFSTKDVPFDMLIETIRSLNPLALGVERTTDDGTVVAILVVMEILADKDKEPKLKFHGLYFSKDSESLDKDTIIKHIPIDVELMTTYRYDSSVSDVILLGQQDQSNYFLTVDDTDITFKTRPEGPSEAFFTMHKYNSTNVTREAPQAVILVPQGIPSQCLAASSNYLTLESFDQTSWTGTQTYTQNQRFLLLVDMNITYAIESSTGTGNYIAKGSDDGAIMSFNPFLFFIDGPILRNRPISKSLKESQEENERRFRPILTQINEKELPSSANFE